jgi:hypothetical protein
MSKYGYESSLIGTIHKFYYYTANHLARDQHYLQYTTLDLPNMDMGGSDSLLLTDFAFFLLGVGVGARPQLLHLQHLVQHGFKHARHVLVRLGTRFDQRGVFVHASHHLRLLEIHFFVRQITLGTDKYDGHCEGHLFAQQIQSQLLHVTPSLVVGDVVHEYESLHLVTRQPSSTLIQRTYISHIHVRVK